MLKRMIALLAVLTLLSSCAAAETVSDGTRQIGMKTVPFYIRSLDNQLPGGFPLYFADGAEDLAYVDLSDWGEPHERGHPGSDRTKVRRHSGDSRGG